MTCAEVIALTNRKLLHFELGETATLLCATSSPPLRPVARLVIRLQSIAVPPPDRSERARPRDLKPHPPLGVESETLPATATVAAFPPGAVLVFYTDGLIERRHEALDFGRPVIGEEGTGGAKPEYVRRAVDASLRRLGTDRIDLYQIHRADPETPIADTLGALDELVQAGKVREIGCSNFWAEQIREADKAARAAGGARLSASRTTTTCSTGPTRPR